MSPEDIWLPIAIGGGLVVAGGVSAFAGCRGARHRNPSRGRRVLYYVVLIAACVCGVCSVAMLTAVLSLAVKPARREANYTTLARQSGEFWPCCEGPSFCGKLFRCFLPSLTLHVLEQTAVSNITLYANCKIYEKCVDEFFANFPPVSETRQGFYLPDSPTDIAFMYRPLGSELITATAAIVGLAIGTVLGMILEHISWKSSNNPNLL